MSETVGTICRLTVISSMFERSLEAYAHFLDEKQFESAAVEIGRMAQIGSELNSLEHRMIDELRRAKHAFETKDGKGI